MTTTTPGTATTSTTTATPTTTPTTTTRTDDVDAAVATMTPAPAAVGEEVAWSTTSTSGGGGGGGVLPPPPPPPIPSSSPTTPPAPPIEASTTTTTTVLSTTTTAPASVEEGRNLQQQPPTKKARIGVESAIASTATTVEPPDDSDDGADDDAAEDEPVVEDDEANDEPVVDWAERHGLRAGDRLQVLWTIQNHHDDDVDEEEGDTVPVPGGEPSSEPSNPQPLGKTETAHWWGATLEPWDGTSEGGSAIRSLEYDAHLPDFPCQSRESVVFTHLPDALLTYPDLEAMHVRRERNGMDDDDCPTPRPASHEDHSAAAHDAIVDAGTSEPEQLLNAVLEGLLHKHADKWQSLPPAHQAAVAEAVAHQKARLAELLRERQQSKFVVTEDDVKEILAKAAEGPA